MKIGQLAALTGVSVRVLRHYEAQSLIRSERDANGYREYPSEVIEIVKVIRTLLHCGFSTRHLREIPLCIRGRIDGSPEAGSWGRARAISRFKRSRIESRCI